MDADATRLTPGPVAPEPGQGGTRQRPAGAANDRLPTGVEGGHRRAAIAGATEGPLLPGQLFGTRYHIIRLIGLGGMGAVYQAWDSELGVVVAVKLVRPEIAADPDAARDLERRFKRELLLARQVTHKNVVRIHDLGEIDGIKYITMPYIDGADLATILDREGALPPRRALEIARPALAGLVAAHDAGVVHRDLKPANIMVDNAGEALIMDFGIARSSGTPPSAARGPSGARAALAARDAGHTMAGAVVGTLQYMAPEQARGQEADQRADIYAFGLILYDMLLGRRRLASAGNAFEELQSRLEAAPPSARELDPSVPEALDRVVMRCLRPDAAERYVASRDLAAALDRLDEDGKPLTVARRVSLPMAATFVLMLVLAGLAFWQAWRSPPPRTVERDPLPLLIADFDNRPGDPLFTGTLEPALSVGIEGAPFVTSFSRDDAARLARAMKPDSRLDATMARLVAVREGIKLVLAGRIEASGDGYAISVEGLDPTDGRQLWIQRTTVSNKDQVLAGIARLAGDVREVLGDAAPAAERAAASERFTTTSLEALQDYTTAQSLAAAGRNEEAIAAYARALEHDPQFGRAHSGWATSAFYLGRKDEAEGHWMQALALTDRMSEREKYRTLGAYYLGFARNYEKAIENYRELVSRYPTDLAGYNNLAFAYFSVLDFPKALEEGLRARDLYPRNVVIGSNYALYAMYAGNFTAAADEARRLIADQPDFYKNYLPLAVAALADHDFAAAEEAYKRMAATGPQGASLARMGLADLAIYRGQYPDAERTLAAGLAEDARTGETMGRAMKLTALADLYRVTGRRPPAIATARQALALSRQEPIVVQAALVLMHAGRTEEAASLALDLSKKLDVQSRAFAKILEAALAAQQQQLAEAIDAYRAGIQFADLWLARLGLGVTCVEAGQFAEALAELEACDRRRGEATAVFLDDTPSFRYLATLPYWLGRAQEGLAQSAAAAASYERFLAVRTGPPFDALVGDARRRLGR